MRREVTIEIPEELTAKLDKIVAKENCRVEHLIIESLRRLVEEKLKRLNDPFFGKTNTTDSGLKDISESHDKYIYDALSNK